MTTITKYVMRPFGIPEANRVHLEPIFQDFRVTIDRRVEELAMAAPTPFSVALGAVLTRLRSEVDAEAYAEIQRRFLLHEKDDDLIRSLKFLDAPFWLEGKMRIGWRLGLQKPPRLRILDLGTGAAHFLMAAKYWGHSVAGMDLPESFSPTAALFGALRRVFGIAWQPAEITAFKPLPRFKERFDLVTALLVNFCGPRERPWNSEAWSFFLEDVRENLLARDGKIYLQLNGPLVPGEAWAHLTSKALWFEEKSKQIML